MRRRKKLPWYLRWLPTDEDGVLSGHVLVMVLIGAPMAFAMFAGAMAQFAYTDEIIVPKEVAYENRLPWKPKDIKDTAMSRNQRLDSVLLVNR